MVNAVFFLAITNDKESNEPLGIKNIGFALRKKILAEPKKPTDELESADAAADAALEQAARDILNGLRFGQISARGIIILEDTPTSMATAKMASIGAEWFSPTWALEASARFSPLHVCDWVQGTITRCVRVQTRQRRRPVAHVADLQILKAELEETFGPMPSVAVALPDGTDGKKRGAPPTWDWQTAFVQVLWKLLKAKKIPKKRSHLAKELQDYFNEKNRCFPEKTAVYAKIKQLIPNFENGTNSGKLNSKI
jgi:hypothetical protein